MRSFYLFSMAFAFFFATAFSTLNAQNQPEPSDYPYWIEMMQDQNANFDATVDAFEAYWENREVTKGSGYKPFKRWEYMMSQRVNPDGSRPAPDRELKALQQFRNTRSNQTTGGDWEALGPFTVPSGYNGYRGLGRINAIAFHPSDENHFYIGAPAGGLWETTDHGASWEVLTDHLPTLGVSSIVVDFSNPDLILIGTGDRDAGDAPGLGVWRSDDGGLNWEVSNNGMGNATVGRMIQHPDFPETIFAATSNGIFVSDDSGLNWSQVRSGNFKEIVFKPGDPEIIYAATGGSFYRSDDGGNNFSQINSGLPGGARGVIGVSDANPEVVYFLLTNSDSFKGLYRSDDSGLSFTMRSTSPNIMSWDCNGGSGGQAWYDLDIAVDPLDEDVIIAGGVNSFKSTDGGTSWTIRSHWYGGCGVESVHADLHILEYNPLNGQLFVGNDGGIYWTADGGVNWDEITNGLVISQAYKLGVSHTNPDYVINGYQDNGSSTFVGGTDNWVSVGGGDGMECAFDPTDDRYSYSTIYYGSIDRIFNNNNQGQIAGQGENGITESGGWVTPFLIDHEDGNIMFVGYKNIWRSTNIKSGSTSTVQWQKISSMNNNNMNVMAQSRANTSVLYVSSGEKLWYTDDAKAPEVTWISRTGNLPLSNVITALETSPIDENVVYMAQQTRIYKSEDKGASWNEITANLSNIQINSIAIYKNAQEALYIGTDVGVFYKDASLDEWIEFGNGMPASAKVTEVEFYYDEENMSGDMLRAATYGRGLWSSQPFIGTLEADFAASSTELTAGCTIDFTDLTTGTPFEWSWTFTGATPSSSNEQHPTGIQYDEEGVYTVSLTVTNPIGMDTHQKTDYITVAAASAPATAFEADQTAGCTGMTVHFTDLSENCPDSWQWSFDPSSVAFMEGTDENSQNPVVQFNEDAAYAVTLVASNQTGSNTFSLENYIHTGGDAIPYAANFDVQTISDAGWTLDNPDDGRSWELAQVNDSHAVWMNFFNYTSMGARDYLVSPVLNFRDFDQAFLRFEYAYAQRYMQKDSLIVSISEDCGESWVRVYANGPDGEGIFETAEPTTTFFEALNQADWCGQGYGAPCPMIDLSDWAGKSNLQIRLEAYNNYGNNLYIKNLEISNITGQDWLSWDANCMIYPNPAKTLLSITLMKESKNTQVRITDLTGRTVSTSNFSGKSFDMDISALPVGAYLLILNQDGEIFNRKILISR
ncbi:MAG: T9SS type A sorting domain-containing protein [Bacteroidetes bacterium]|nr:T9SS type A sorting domain-containing protein [Bacteroidota bacterium]MBU1580699.1 T9SS type A sorting domain-containing protein [Bacteroidota bacterium]MBU2466339.1 T9SS type A sorting domain-containing protein [Bacteroidota bacterium]MBU2558107.1 T9SS type A sorting domain-containing protein [Bacteroidota bacterium]